MVAKHLDQLAIPGPAYYSLWAHEHGNGVADGYLSWQKHKGKRRICYVVAETIATPQGPDEQETVTPYEEWSAERKLEMLAHVSGLFEAAKETIERFVKKVGGDK